MTIASLKKRLYFLNEVRQKSYDVIIFIFLFVHCPVPLLTSNFISTSMSVRPCPLKFTDWLLEKVVNYWRKMILFSVTFIMPYGNRAVSKKKSTYKLILVSRCRSRWTYDFNVFIYVFSWHTQHRIVNISLRPIGLTETVIDTLTHQTHYRQILNYAVISML